MKYFNELREGVLHIEINELSTKTAKTPNQKLAGRAQCQRADGFSYLQHQDASMIKDDRGSAGLVPINGRKDCYRVLLSLARGGQ